jgi:simple sugar transport system permease protein
MKGGITLKKLLKRNETYVFLTILLLALVIQLRSGQFFTANNIVDLMVAMIVPGMMCISVFVVIISGGIDVSFPAIASISMYITTDMLLRSNFTGSVFWAFAISAGFGLLFGSLNGLLASWLNLPTLIITLGTSSVFQGIMLGALNAREIADIPNPMNEFGNSALLVAKNPVSGLTSNLSPGILIFIGIVIVSFLILRYTILGRSIYAIGGDETAAKRAGFNVKKTKFFVYAYSGLIAGIAGMTRVCMLQNCYPTNLLGTEMTAIAAAVLGGASIAGGIGTLTGAILGVALITTMSNSMILLGIPTYWQSFFTGMLILLGIAISAYQTMRSKKKMHCSNL